MENNLIKGLHSSYTITVSVSADDRATLHQKTLQSLQGEVKIQGFRQGHVPLHLVEQHIQPEYLKMAFLEEILNASIKGLLKEHPAIAFIGQPYNLHQEEKEETLILTYTLDAHPEVAIINDGWKNIRIPAIDNTISEQEQQQAIANLQRQYAEYEDAARVEKNTLVKASYTMTDKDGAELHKGSAFFGEEEYTESLLLWNAVEGKEKGDSVDIAYEEAALPHAVHYHPHGSEIAQKIKTLHLTLIDLKSPVLPDFHDAAILEKLFQSPDITTYDALVAKIYAVLGEQKEENLLQQSIETMIQEARASLSVEIPETFLKEEMQARIKQLGQRMGGEEGLKQYFDKIGEEKTNELYDEMKTSAKESLEKFFILRKIVELLEIPDIQWEKQLDAEKKIYEKLKTAETNTKAETSTKKIATDAPKKKAPAKKAAKEKTAE